MTIDRRCLNLPAKAPTQSFANLSSMSDLECSGLGQSFDLELEHFLHLKSDDAIAGKWKLQGSFSRSSSVNVGHLCSFGLTGGHPVE